METVELISTHTIYQYTAVGMCEKMAYCGVLEYRRCVSGTNDIRSAVVTVQKEASPTQTCKLCKLGTCCVYNFVVLCIL